MSAFSLKPYEDQVPGVRFRDGSRRLRPTWAATTLDLYGAVAALFVAVVGVAMHNAATAIGGFAVSAVMLPYLRCRVVADDHRIVVVNKWGSSSLDVDDIKRVDLKDFRSSFFAPFRDPLTLWPRTLTACSLVMRDDAVVRCDALVGLPRGSDTEDPSPIEVKSAILKRWVECTQGSV